MALRRSDWLDRLALRSLGQPNHDADARGVAPPGNEEQFSRSAVVKLALAGAASISFGLWKPALVLAQDPDANFTKCLVEHDRALAVRTHACELIFNPRSLYRNEPLSWGRLRGLVYGGERDIEFAGIVLNELCVLKSQHRMERFKRECYKEVEENCRPKRSVQLSSGRSTATCEVTPPPHAPPPTIPPIPNPTEGVAVECANCSLSGGECCYGDDPTHLCGCAGYKPPGENSGCPRLGCKSG